LFRLVCVSTQFPLQSVWPAVQPEHWLFWQVPPLAQFVFVRHSTHRLFVVLHTGRPVFAQF
jgi:hypothetical protein